MHNRAFFERVRSAVRQRIPDLPEDIDKTEAFRLLASRVGASSLVEVGREIWVSDVHPVMAALIRPGEVLGVLERWTRLERFSHTHNRTRITESSATGERLRLVLEHHALGGRSIDTQSHLFVWGVLVGLFERAHLPVDRVRLHGGGALLFEGGSVHALRHVPASARLAEFIWTETRRSPPSVPLAPEGHLPRAVRALLASDVTRSWRLNQVACQLGVSSRTLQRSLRADGAAFSEILLTTRLGHARELLEDARLSLTDVAFSSGFSDQAHMTRAARARWMLAPSQFRVLLGG